MNINAIFEKIETLTHKMEVNKKDKKEISSLVLNTDESLNKHWTIVQLHIVDVIKHSEEKVNNKYLADRLKVSKAAITKAINILIERNIIVENKQSDNKKSKYYLLTENGDKLALVHKEAHNKIKNDYYQMLGEFTEDELEIINKFLNKWENII